MKKIFKIEFFISIVALVISIFSLYLSKNANDISQRSNDITEKGQNESLNFSMDQRSQNYVEDIYKSLYEDKENYKVVSDIRNNIEVEDIEKLTFVIDYLESTGSSFCQGTVWKWHLNTTLKNTLEIFCENDQILSEFEGRKNGFAMLCREFFPESKFSKTLQTYNLQTCDFYDSSELNRLIEEL